MPRERRRGLLLFEYPIRAKSLWILNKATLRKDVPSLTQTLLLTRPSGSLRSCAKACRPTWPSESSVVPDKIAGPGTERGLGAHRGAASPAQTGTGKQGPPIARPRVMSTRASRRPKDENQDVRETYGLMGDGETGTIAATPEFRPVLRYLKAPSLLRGDLATDPVA